MNHDSASTDSGDRGNLVSRTFVDHMIDAILCRLEHSEEAKPSDPVSSKVFEEDTISAHLLVETALIDTAGFSILKYRRVEQLKKDLAATNARLLAAYQKLKLDCKVHHATQSLSRITNGSNLQHEIPSRSQQELEKLVLEIQELVGRKSDAERILNQHYSAVLNIANTRLTTHLQELTEYHDSSNECAELSTEGWKNRCQQLEQEMDRLLINFEGLTMEAIEKERGVLDLSAHSHSSTEGSKRLTSHNWNLPESEFGQSSSIDLKGSSWISQMHLRESLKEEFSWLIQRLRTDNLNLIKDLKLENQRLRCQLEGKEYSPSFDA